MGSLFDDVSLAPDPGPGTPRPRTLSPGTRISVPEPEVPGRRPRVLSPGTRAGSLAPRHRLER